MGSSVNWWRGVPVNRYHNKSCLGLVISGHSHGNELEPGVSL